MAKVPELKRQIVPKHWVSATLFLIILRTKYLKKIVKSLGVGGVHLAHYYMKMGRIVDLDSQENVP